MKRTNKRHEDASAIALVEETFHCLRTAPAGLLARYYVGTIPFVLALVYYFFDMWLHAFAEERVAGGALILVVLFIWMKTWQTLYANRLYAWVCDAPLRPPSLKRTLRIALKQTIVQTTGILLLPFAILFVAPFGVCYAIYQNLTVLDDGNGKTPPRALFAEAIAQAMYQSRQNHVLIWLLSPFLVVFTALVWRLLLPLMTAAAPEWLEGALAFYGVLLLIILVPFSPFGILVALNIAAGLTVAPMLLRILFGIQTNFSVAGLGQATPFIFIVCALTYLCLDPLIKAAYVLRCFYGRSRETGEDLLVELRRVAKSGALTLLLAGAFVLGADAAQAQQSPSVTPAPGAGAVQADLIVGAGELNEALDAVLEDRRFAWRSPRVVRQETEDNWFTATIKNINDKLSRGYRRTTNWLEEKWDGLMGGGRGSGSETSSSFKMRYLIYLLIAVLALVVAFFAWRAWRRRPADPEIVAKAVTLTPDLDDESTTAADLPEAGWLDLAREMMNKGDKRLAMRAFFLAGLARLADQDLIRIARYKSNRDYGRELQRIAHENPQLPKRYAAGMRMFEAVWYGVHEVTSDMLKQFVTIQEDLRPHAH